MKAKWYGPRERILEFGPQSLSDVELLSALLGTGGRCGTPGVPSVLVLAEQIYQRFRGLKGLLCADARELLEVGGLGRGKVARLLAVAELLRRASKWQGDPRSPVTQPEEALSLFKGLLLESQEVLSVAFLDTQNRVIAMREIFRGAVDSSIAQPREILREGLRLNASRIVVAHNHPSGDPQPSHEDRVFTHRMQSACDAVGIPLLDHLIIGSSGYFSFAKDLRTPLKVGLPSQC